MAGCEAAWQAARAGQDVTLHEMRPVRPTLVHKTGDLRRVGVQQLLPRRQARQRRRAHQGRDAPAGFGGDAALATKAKASRSLGDVLDHVWTAEEAARFLKAAKDAGPQLSGLFALALDSGMRRGEIGGLQWADVDWAKGTIRVQRSLLSRGREPKYGLPKTKAGIRVIDLSPETMALLKTHKQHQAELKMRNRVAYQDHGLVFAKEWDDLHGREDSLGAPLAMHNCGDREMRRISKVAGVRRIKFHGLRHTMATLMLSAGVPPPVVQRRLGHSKIEMTLGIYSHVLPGQQADAAARLAALLHG